MEASLLQDFKIRKNASFLDDKKYEHQKRQYDIENVIYHSQLKKQNKERLISTGRVNHPSSSSNYHTSNTNYYHHPPRNSNSLSCPAAPIYKSTENIYEIFHNRAHFDYLDDPETVRDYARPPPLPSSAIIERSEQSESVNDCQISLLPNNSTSEINNSNNIHSNNNNNNNNDNSHVIINQHNTCEILSRTGSVSTSHQTEQSTSQVTQHPSQNQSQQTASHMNLEIEPTRLSEADTQITVNRTYVPDKTRASVKLNSLFDQPEKTNQEIQKSNSSSVRTEAQTTENAGNSEAGDFKNKTHSHGTTLNPIPITYSNDQLHNENLDTVLRMTTTVEQNNLQPQSITIKNNSESLRFVDEILPVGDC